MRKWTFRLKCLFDEGTVAQPQRQERLVTLTCHPIQTCLGMHGEQYPLLRSSNKAEWLTKVNVITDPIV